MFKGIENLRLGQFTPTPEEKKINPDIKKKMEAANVALRKRAAEQAGGKLERGFADDEEERSEEDLEKVA